MSRFVVSVVIGEVGSKNISERSNFIQHANCWADVILNAEEIVEALNSAMPEGGKYSIETISKLKDKQMKYDKSKINPTPYRVRIVEKDNRYGDIIFNKNSTLAWNVKIDTAQHIVHCVNSHGRLVAMLEEVVGNFESLIKTCKNVTDLSISHREIQLNKAKALINEIKETKQ